MTDLIWRRIFNSLTVTSALLGFVFSAWTLGWYGLGESFFGFFIGLLLYGGLFYLKVIGGGDVKLLMALGSWGGAHFTVEASLLAVVLGGFNSIFILILKGKLMSFSKRMYPFIMSLFVYDLEFQLPKIDKELTMPFGISIAFAAVWTIFNHPFVLWGLIVWKS